jgi:hypothetical protein
MSIPMHSFRLIVDRWPTGQEWDEIADTCPDAGWNRLGPGAQVEFDRACGSLVEAIASAIYDLAGYHGLEVRAIDPVPLVWGVCIADRVGMTEQELEAKIAASPAAHAKPMKADGGLFYHWPDLVDWLAAHGIPALAYDKTIRAANAALAKLDQAAVSTHDRKSMIDRIIRSIDHQLKRIDMWRMPEWMEPYRSYIAETGGNEIEELLFDFEHDRNMMRTNIPRFVLACMARAQVGLLERLHKDGCLPPAPNSPGGW